MSDPKRWLEDESADPAMQADLRAAKDAAPPALDYAAGLVALRAATRGGGGGGPTGGGSVAIGAGAIAIVVAIALLATRPDAAEREAVVAPREVPVAPTIADEPVVIAPTTTVESETETESETERESETESAVAPRPVRAHVPTTAAPPEEPSTETVMREARATREIRLAVDHDPAHALELARAAATEFGDGSFGEERDALRILALVALDRDAEAHRLGTAFLAAHGRGLYAERVRRAIGAAE